MSFRTPLGTVLGRGTARDGASHWWVERITALALVPLTVWFLAALLALHRRHGLQDHAGVAGWLGSGWSTVFMLLFIVTLTWHSRLGVQVVIEDYVHTPGRKLALLLASATLHLVAAAGAIFAVLKLAFGG